MSARNPTEADDRRDEGVLVTLKEHLLRLMEDYRAVADREHRMLSLHIDDVEKRLILMHEAEVERIETMLKSEEKAWDLYRGEVNQRLDTLNHSQERADRVQSTYVLREVADKRAAQVDEKVAACLPRVAFEVSQDHAQEERKEVQGWMNRVNEALARMAERRSVSVSIATAVLALVGTIAGIIIQLTKG